MAWPRRRGSVEDDGFRATIAVTLAPSCRSDVGSRPRGFLPALSITGRCGQPVASARDGFPFPRAEPQERVTRLSLAVTKVLCQPRHSRPGGGWPRSSRGLVDVDSWRRSPGRMLPALSVRCPIRRPAPPAQDGRAWQVAMSASAAPG